MKIDLEKMKKGLATKDLLEFGIININKPRGPTSFTVSDFVRKIAPTSKTSHFGTLDPKVTGVLPIAMNRACKLTGYFIGEDKEYVGIMRMHDEISIDVVRSMIEKKFIGEIIQMPPVKSRVKRQLRPRMIYEFELLEQGGCDILFRTKCQGGTYIRKLCSDLGDELGVGAHMLELRRTNAGIFFEDDDMYPCVSLYELEEAVKEYEDGDDETLRRMIIPGEVIMTLHKTVEAKADTLKYLYVGRPLREDDLTEESKEIELVCGETVCVFCDGRFVGIYEVKDDAGALAKAKFVNTIL